MYSNNLSPQKTNTIDIFVQITGLINPICKKMYEETDRRVDKYCRYLYTLTKFPWFFIVVPFPFISYALYFTTDLEEESFFLPFTVWYYHRTLICSSSKYRNFQIGFYSQGSRLIGDIQ